MSRGHFALFSCRSGRDYAEKLVKQLSHLPIIVDPSHGTGRRDKVIPMSRAAIAAGADGLLVEVHHDPLNALSDAAQSISLEMFEQLVRQVGGIAGAVGRSSA